MTAVNPSKMLCFCFTFVQQIHDQSWYITDMSPLSVCEVMKGHIRSRNVTFKRSYLSRVNKDVVSFH